MLETLRNILFIPVFGIYFILVKVFKLNFNWGG